MKKIISIASVWGVVFGFLLVGGFLKLPMAFAAKSPANISNKNVTPPSTTAGTITNATTTCDLDASGFAAIQSIQNNSNLTSNQELNQELALRKQLLGQTIACAENNDQALQQTLSSVSMNDGASAIQSRLGGRISDALNFYSIESVKLQDAGVAGTQAIAKELVAWRAANDAPLPEEVNNLILWSQDQVLFSTAASRVSQTGQVVSFIESATPNSALQTSFDDAQVSFKNAETENAAAETDLGQFLPPDQSLAVIQQSLTSLADAYQKLSDLNTLLQQLLPTGSN